MTPSPKDLEWATTVLSGAATPVEGCSPDAAERRRNRHWAALHILAQHGERTEAVSLARAFEDDPHSEIRAEALATRIAHSDEPALERARAILRGGVEDPIVLMRVLESVREFAPDVWRAEGTAIARMREHPAAAVRRAALGR